jgi:hypothetical protein
VNSALSVRPLTQTGATASLWTVGRCCRAPGASRCVYMTEHDMNLAEVLAEALEEWAKAKGVDLPPRNPYLAWAS